MINETRVFPAAAYWSLVNTYAAEGKGLEYAMALAAEALAKLPHRVVGTVNLRERGGPDRPAAVTIDDVFATEIVLTIVEREHR